MKTTTYSTLYNIDSKGKVRCYQTIVTPGEGVTVIKVTTGLLTGKKTSKDTEVTKGKNLGKANATNHFTQAIADADSSNRKKIAKGYKTLKELGIEVNPTKQGHVEGFMYCYTIDGKPDCTPNLETAILTVFPEEKKYMLPMKYGKYRCEDFVEGTKAYKESRVLNFPFIAEPKLDGVNGIGDKEEALSTRGGKIALTNGGDSWNDICPQIAAAIRKLNYHTKLNGEVYLHGHGLQDITDACKKKNALSGKLQFHIFDICDKEFTYTQRRKHRIRLIGVISDLGLDDVIRVVPSKMIFSHRELMAYEEAIIKAGYEGIMCKRPGGMYRDNHYRSPDALKLVRMDKMEVEVKDVIPMEKEPDLGKFVCLYKGREFNVSPGKGFDKPLKRNILKNKANYIGQMLTISHRGFTSHDFPRIAQGEGGAEAFRAVNDL